MKNLFPVLLFSFLFFVTCSAPESAPEQKAVFIQICNLQKDSFPDCKVYFLTRLNKDEKIDSNELNEMIKQDSFQGSLDSIPSGVPDCLKDTIVFYLN